MMGGSARWIASGLGCGFSPKAPGTVGSAVALAIGAGLWVASPWLVAFAAAVATVLGLAGD